MYIGVMQVIYLSFSILVENTELHNEPEFTVTAKLWSTLLKRPIDLSEEDGGGRKQVALSTIGERNVDIAGNLDPDFSSDGQDTTEYSLAAYLAM